MRGFLALASLLLLAFALLWWRTRTDAPERTAARATERPVAAAAPSSPDEAPPFASELEVDARVALVEPEHDTVTRALNRRARDQPRTGLAPFEGRVLVTDETGEVHDDLDGEIELWVSGGKKVLLHGVEIVDGRWRIDVPRPAQVLVSTLTLAGRAAVVDDPAGRAPVGDDDLVLRAHFVPRVTLNVIDARTKAPLSEITLIAAPNRPRSDLEHPGHVRDHGAFLREATSPIAIDPSSFVGERRARFFVYSPGHSWGRILLDMTSGGERSIELEPGGDLAVEVEVEADVELRALRLRMRPIEATGPWPYLDTKFPQGMRLELTGIRPGTYRLTLEQGKFVSEAIELASSTVHIVAEQQTELEVLVPAPSERAEVPLEGMLVVPEEWGLRKPKLVVRGLEPTSRGHRIDRTIPAKEMVQLLEGTWAWSTRVPPGTYAVGLEDEPWYLVQADVGAEGLTGVQVLVPPPGSLTVDLIDQRTRSPVTDEELHLFLSYATPEAHPWAALPRHGKTPGRFEIRAVRGDVLLATDGGRYVPNECTVPLGSEPSSIVIELAPACEIALELRSGDTVVPIEDGWGLEPRGSGDLVDILDPGCFHVDLPGVYRFDFPALPGFEPVPPQVVEARLGERVEHVVKLVHER